MPDRPASAAAYAALTPDLQNFGPSWVGQNNTTPVANTFYVAAFAVPGPALISGLDYYINSAIAGNARALLLDAAGTVLAQSASSALPGTFRLHALDFTAAYAAAKGKYHLAVAFDNATANIGFAWARGGRTKTDASGTVAAPPASIAAPAAKTYVQVPIMSTY